MNSRYDFRLKLLKKTLTWWNRDSLIKINLPMIIGCIIVMSMNILFFLLSDEAIRWFSLGAAIALVITLYIFYRRHLITLFRIITGRCVKDIAALKFEYAVNNSIEPSTIACPICNSRRMTIYPIYEAMDVDGDTHIQAGLICHFCGFEFETKS